MVELKDSLLGLMNQNFGLQNFAKLINFSVYHLNAVQIEHHIGYYQRL